MASSDGPGFDPRQPFRRADALANGISPRKLRSAAFTRILHDVYVSSDVEVTVTLRAKVALSLLPEDAHISHYTAATLYKAWVPDDADIHASVRKRKQRRRRNGMAVHLAHPTCQVVTRKGLRVSHPVQIFLDMARYLNLVDLVVLGDSLVHRELVTPPQLIAAAASWRGYGAVRARRAAAMVRHGVESPMETRLRLLVVLAGLPEPVIAHTITRPDGTRRIRFDLCYPGFRVAIEYDGRQHAESSHQWQHDLGRREDLDRLRWRLVIVTHKGIYVEPAVTLNRIVTALREQGATALRPSCDDEWRRHFPGRAAA
jgi:hypothetical protein